MAEVLSLARPFLAAGVPAVVASLWEVEDEPTARLLTAFHRHLRGGESALAALRSAQRELLADPDPALRSPAYWAAFELFGGGLPG
jgi:CHAT domain-containing protein